MHIGSGLGVAILLAAWGVEALAKTPYESIAQAGDRALLQQTGSLEDSDAAFDDGSPYDIHSFEGKAGQFVQLTAASEAFDSYLILLDPRGNRIAENDDATLGSSNASIALQLPQDGTYQLFVNSYDPRGRGNYVLVVTERTEEEVRAANVRAEAVGLFQRARGLEREGSAASLREAAEIFEEVAGRYGALGDDRSQALALGQAAFAYDTLEENQKALELFAQTLPLLRAVGDRGREAIVLNDIGTLYSELGESQKAIEFLERALPLYREVGDRDGEGAALYNIGLSHARLENYPTALDFFERALPLYQAGDDRIREADTLHNTGTVYAALGDKQKSLAFLERALSIYRTAGDSENEAHTLKIIERVRSEL